MPGANADGVATLLLVGDLILDEPEPESFFELSVHALRTGDVVVGQVEVPHTFRGIQRYVDIPASGADPRNLSALVHAGFNVATLAGNHVFDQGEPGIEDTIAALRQHGISTVGAGMNIAEARHPVIIERKGIRFGFLSYNCVGPADAWAGRNKPGCAYVQILTHYEPPRTAGPPATYTFAEPKSAEAMEEDIQNLRPQCDILVVAMHKGVGHVPAELAMYERPLAHAAIDAGADVIVGHHAHILKGIEVYRGKPIFHGMGNFVTVTRALSLGNNPSPERLEWAKRRKELYGVEADPDTPTFPFHREARNTIIAKCIVNNEGISRISIIPCYINKKAQPEVLKNDERGKQAFEYLASITRAARLNARYEWEGGEVVIQMLNSKEEK